MRNANVEGLLLVDKAKGTSSFKVVSKVRRALGTRAVGHVGTLDPLASGLLVFLIGRYTRLSNYLMAGTKQYRAVVELGVSTNTDDKEGEVLASVPADHLSLEQISDIVSGFQGVQQQIPPAFSAISVDGVRSYKRARAGEVVEMAPRSIEIHEISILSYQHPLLTIDVKCSKGTYIRSLARDIGERLGVPAHLADLRRIDCSGYNVVSAISEADLDDPEKALAHLQTGVKAILGIPTLTITEAMALRLRNGLRVNLNAADPQDCVIATRGDDPVAICKIENSELITIRGF